MEEIKGTSVSDRNLVLVPVDFTTTTENAIRHASELAVKLKARICMLHVSGKQAATAGPVNREIHGDPFLRLKELKARYEAVYPLEFSLAHKKGNILKTIVKTASELNTRLIVMGTHGKTGFQHLFGSYALKVVLDSPCPVLVVQDPPTENSCSNIILPVSSELEARNSMDWAILLAKVYGSQVRLVLANEPDSTLKKRMDIIVDQIREMLDGHGIPCDVCPTGSDGDFPSLVIRCADEAGTGLILAMTMPGTDMPGFSPSSWNEKLLFNDARVPVLCINPSDTGALIPGWLNTSQ